MPLCLCVKISKHKEFSTAEFRFSRDGVWGFDEASAAAFRAFLAKVKADRELTKAFFR